MQKRKKHIISACSILFIVFLFLNVQHAAATPKKVLMGDFIVNNQKTVGGFVNSADSDATDLDPFTSYTSVYILDLLDRIDDINDEQAESWFFGQMDEAVATESLSDLYYSYLGHETSGGLLNDSSVAEKAEFVKSLQDNINYGFSDSNETTENIVDTYYAIEALDAMGYLGDDEFGVQKANVVNFISSFWSNTYGGFVQGSRTKPSVIDTYYALQCLKTLDGLDLDDVQINNISALVETYYVGDESFSSHYGGYSYSQTNPQSSITLTYYCVSIKSLLELSLTDSDTTLDWLLSRQNTEDYGFADVSELPSEERSSTRLTYFAVDTILSIKPNALDENGVLSQNVWELQTSKGELAGIIVGVVGGIIILGVGYWKYRTRMKV